MDHSGMAVRIVSATGLPPEVLTFTIDGGEAMTYRREQQERAGQGWHAHYEDDDAALSASAG